MDQIPRQPGSLNRAGIPVGIVGVSIGAGSAAHVAAALTGPAGAMAWWMAAMGAACLACASPLAVRARCTGRAAKHLLKAEPPSKSLAAAAFGQLGPPIAALARSTVQGRAAFASVAALDPALADAIKSSNHCQDLRKEQA